MIQRGILRGFDSGTFLAAVQLDGLAVNVLSGMPVSRAIASGDMVAGRKVAVWLPGSDPAAGVVFAVWT